MSARRVVVRVRCLYERCDVEIFDGTPKAVRAALLLRFSFLRRRGEASQDLRAVVGDLDSAQAYSARLVTVA